MRKEVHKRVNLDAYNYILDVVLTDDIVATRKRYDKEFGTSVIEPKRLALSLGLHECDESGHSVLILKFDSQPGTLAHEAWHVIWYVYQYMGEGEPFGNESVAYLLSHIVDSIIELQVEALKKLKADEAVASKKTKDEQKYAGLDSFVKGEGKW